MSTQIFFSPLPSPSSTKIIIIVSFQLARRRLAFFCGDHHLFLTPALYE